MVCSVLTLSMDCLYDAEVTNKAACPVLRGQQPAPATCPLLSFHIYGDLTQVENGSDMYLTDLIGTEVNPSAKSCQ